MSRAAADAVIVGGGLIGCALAAELAGRGLGVVVVERGRPGEEASGAAAGMLSPQADAREPSPFFDLALESRGLYPDWTGRIREETGLDVGYRRTGVLRAVSPAEAESVRAGVRWQKARGLSVEELTRDGLDLRLAARLSSEDASFVFYPDEAVVDPRRLTRACWLLAERRGARILTSTAVTRFEIERGACIGVATDAGPMASRRVVDAAGAWAGFEGNLPVSVPVAPVRGQIVEIRLGRPLETVVASEQVYVVPRQDGTVLLGSTLEHVGFRKEVTAAAVASLLGRAARLLPEIDSAEFLTAWAGLRPGTPDGWPLLGESGIGGLFLASGHFRNGILLAPATARRMADLICNGRGEALAAFSLDRFAAAPCRA